MTLIKRGKYYHYDFWHRGKRHQRSTGQERAEDAEQVERDVKRRLRQEAHGIASVDRSQSPSFTAWAETCLAQKTKTLGRVDIYERTLRMVLAFWGARPSATPAVDGGVYHDLRLLDPVLDPMWIDRFEDWMAVRGVAGTTKNSYRSAACGMYKLALRPRWRQRTHVTMNPFTDIDRDPARPRRVTLTVDEVQRWVTQAPPHARLALIIGALAPKLRLAQVLALRFDRHLDHDLTVITYDDHKTRRHTGESQVTPISPDLRVVLAAVRQARPQSRYVIAFRGKPVTSITRAIKAAAKRATLSFGMKTPGGITFHSLRKVMATECARLGIAEVLAAKALGHRDPRTTRQHYTHLVTADEQHVMSRLGEHLKLTELGVRAARTTKSRPLKPEDLARMKARLRVVRGAG